VENVRAASVPYAPLAHDFNRFGSDVNGAHRKPSLLKDKTVTSGSGAGIQDLPTAEVKGGLLEGGKVFGSPEKDTDRDSLRVPIISVDNYLG
jgi:hypothetical protein